MKAIKIALILYLIILLSGCIKPKPSYLKEDNSGTPVPSKIIWFASIQPQTIYIADSLTTVEVTIGIDPKTTNGKNKIIVSADTGVLFKNGQRTTEGQADYMGMFSTTIIAHTPGPHNIYAKIGDYSAIPKPLVFLPSCPSPSFDLKSDKPSGSPESDFLIDIDLGTPPAIISNNLPITFDAKFKGVSNDSFEFFPSKQVLIINGKASVTVKNTGRQGMGILTITATVKCSGMSISSSPKNIMIN